MEGSREAGWKTTEACITDPNASMTTESGDAEAMSGGATADATAGATPRPSWRWSTFRRGLERRRDAEHAFGLARVGILLLWLVYSLASERSLAETFRRPAPLVALAALGAALWFLNQAAKDPEIAPRRRLAAAALDQCFICVTLVILGDRGAWLLAVSLLVSVANGLHFGRSYGLFAATLSAVGFDGVITLRPEAWAHAETLARAVAAALFVVPAYVALVAERIIKAGERQRARAGELTRITMEDPLTRLVNRAYFKRCLAEAIEGARVDEAEHGFAVICCDLDNFRQINQTHGRATGDSVLRKAAETLRECVRGSDVIARIGGDQFAACLKGISDAEIAKRIGRNIVAAMRAVEAVDSIPVQLSCSVGITMVGAPLAAGVTADRLLQRADEAMAQAKRAGKNQFYLQWANL